MEDGGNGNQPWLPNARDEKKKFRSLKRKYRLLEEENADLSEEVIRSRRLISRLQNERTFILDRLLKLERFYRASDTDTDSGGGSSSESELESESEKKRDTNGVSPPPKRSKIAPSGIAGPPSIINVDPESLGLCTAVVRGRPCKSKSLSGYKYCWHHAPLDPNSPFTWCLFSSKNKKCSIPVLKTKAVPFCKYHEDQAGEGAPKDVIVVPLVDDKNGTTTTTTTTTPITAPLIVPAEIPLSTKKDKKKKKKKKKERKKRSKDKKSKPKTNGTVIDVVGDDVSDQLMINEESEDSEEGMTIVDVEEEEIQVN